MEATGKTARTMRTGTEGRALRDASARVRDGFWYTENLSRALPPPPPPPGEPTPCWDPIAAAAVTSDLPARGDAPRSQAEVCGQRARAI